MPQVRINDDTQEKLLPYAKMMNAQFVWIYSSITVLDATLAYSLNHLGVPTLVTEMGVGNRITPKYCRDIVDGISPTDGIIFTLRENPVVHKGALIARVYGGR